MDFLSLLRDDLREGLALTPAEFRARHSRWIWAQQTEAGGFANRRGKADLYYTAFALRCLSALNELQIESAQRAGAWLVSLARQPDAVRLRQPHGAFCDTVMAGSWWDALAQCEQICGVIIAEDERANLQTLTLARLAQMRRDDGGYAKTPIEAHGSLYHTFIATALHARLGLAVPDEEKVRGFMRALARPDGGFLENKFSKRPGTNGSAAGIFLSLMLADFEGYEKHLDFITTMLGSEGGFEAAPSAPLADLLSTYTALLTLNMGGKLQKKIVDGAREFARGLEDPAGGYAGFALESVVDCEYTFYGLGVESIAARF